MGRKGVVKGMKSVMKDFQKDRPKVFYDTLNNVIDQHHVFGISKEQVIKFLKGKINELDK
jgi:DNA-binding transcriptional regulator YhcF (GntR family)